MFNRDVMEITRSVKQVFESLEKAEDATLQLVMPSYYLLTMKMAPAVRDCHDTHLQGQSPEVPRFDVLDIHKRTALDGNLPRPKLQAAGVHPRE